VKVTERKFKFFSVMDRGMPNSNINQKNEVAYLGAWWRSLFMRFGCSGCFCLRNARNSVTGFRWL
jgi:hypothetical protein